MAVQDSNSPDVEDVVAKDKVMNTVPQETEENDADVPPRRDPLWPQVEHGHPITELLAPTQGAASPYGEAVFPLPADQLGYEHPRTTINR